MINLALQQKRIDMYVYGGCIYKFVTICELCVFVYDQFWVAARTH